MRARVRFRLSPQRRSAFAGSLALGLALCSASVFPARPAHAQGATAAPGSDANADAAARYERGVKAFEEERWREAVELFKEADKLAPSALLSFNIAKVYERMRDGRNALAWYRDYLRRAGAAAERAPVEKRVRELEALLRARGVQQLGVFSTPPGATVVVDDSSRGVTPWNGELAPGPHRLELRLRDYEDAAQSFELPADHAIDLNVQLLHSVTTAGAGPSALPAADPSAATPPVPSAGLGSEPGAAPAASAADGWQMEKPTAVPRWWTWGLFGGSAALLIGSGAVELSRRKLEEDARGTSIQIDYKHKYDAVHDRRDTALLLLGVGGALGIAGGVSFYLDLRRAESTPGGVAVGCEPGACAVQARGVW